jgi:hypothetical protein
MRHELEVKIAFVASVLAEFATATIALIAVLTAAIASTQPAYADLSSSAFLAMPSRFGTEDLSLSSRGLGETCYSRDIMPDGSVCNPAFSDSVHEGFLMGRLYLGNGYTALSSANSLLFQPVSSDFLKGLFQNNTTTLEGEASLVFATKYFSASFTPYRVQYFSEVQNPNYPVIAVQAAVERELEFQGGTALGGISPVLKDFSVGAKLRLINRTFVSGEFSLAQVGADDPQSLLPVQKQLAAYLDPTIGWRPTVGRWKLWTSLGLVNLGTSNNPTPLYQAPVDIAGGVGVEPPLKYGRLRLGLDMVNLINNGGDAASMFKLGGSYKLGIMEAMGGWNENAITGGFLFGFQVVQVGVVYEFLRSELDGGFSENRISTEASIKL